MEVKKVSMKEYEQLQKKLKELSDEQLDAVSGGAGLCPPGCIYADNCCHCPEVEDY